MHLNLYVRNKINRLPVVPLTTSVVTVGLTPPTDTGDTRRTPPIGTVRRMVPG